MRTIWLRSTYSTWTHYGFPCTFNFSVITVYCPIVLSVYSSLLFYYSDDWRLFTCYLWNVKSNFVLILPYMLYAVTVRGMCISSKWADVGKSLTGTHRAYSDSLSMKSTELEIKPKWNVIKIYLLHSRNIRKVSSRPIWVLTKIYTPI